MNNTLHIHQLSSHAEQHDGNADTPLTAAVLLVPSTAISCFELNEIDIPKRYLQQALPGLLEDTLAEAIDEQHISIGPFSKHKNLAVIVAKNQTVQEWLDAASASGVNPSALIPDFYTLPLHDNAISLHVHDGYALVRTGLHNGFAGAPEEINALLQRYSDKVIHIYGSTGDATLEFENSETHPNFTPTLDLKAIDLRHGPFAGKREHANPYTPYRWPLALTALLLLSMSLHFYTQSRFYQAENRLLSDAISADYRQVFGSPIEPNWQTPAKFQTALARLQLSGHKLDNWKLIRQLNEAIAACRSCVIEEFSLNQQGALLTIHSDGSAALITAINDSVALQLTKQQTVEKNITLTISLEKA